MHVHEPFFVWSRAYGDYRDEEGGPVNLFLHELGGSEKWVDSYL